MTQRKLRPQKFSEIGQTEKAEPDVVATQEERYQRFYEYALSLGNSPKAARVFADTRLASGPELQADELIQEERSKQ